MDACYHCGLPAAPDSPWQVVVDGQPRPACCPGCKAVAEAILGAGLSGYYKHRSALPASPPQPATDLGFYDRPEVQDGCVSTLADGSREARLSVSGIRCAACAWLIEQRLEHLPGVRGISVSPGDHSALVRWDAEATTLATIATAIREVGYEAFPHQPDAAAEAREAESRDMLRRLGVAGIGMMQVGMAAWGIWVGEFTGPELVYRDLVNWASFLVATLVVGYSATPFFRAAWSNLRSRHLGMDVPVSLAILVTFAASLVAILEGGEHVYFDSVTMFVFLLLLGRFLEMRARHAAFKAISAGESSLPRQATRLLPDGGSETVPALSLQPGDRVRVRVGELVPADGVVLEGRSSLNEASLTGEFMPVPRGPGERVIGGTLNVEQPLLLQVEAAGAQSRIATIERLLARAAAGKPAIAVLADRMASHFTLGLLVVTALITAGWWWFTDGERALWVAVSMLAITCPCALSLATPTALTASLATLRRAGFLITQPHALETLAEVDRVVFDKTGTLTEGNLSLERSEPRLSSAERALAVCAALEAHSEHPIARAFLSAHRGTAPAASHVAVHPGRGIEGEVDGRHYRLGTPAHASWSSPPPAPPDEQGHWLLLASERGEEAWFCVDDRLRAHAADSIHSLQAQGAAVALLSGDASDAVPRTAAALGIGEVHGACSPEEKLQRVRQWQARGEKVLMVGDGINDAPVLAGADVSVAMGAASDLAKLSADCALLGGQIEVLAGALRQARRTRQIIRQNLAWALAYNGIAIPLAAAEMVSPYVATLGMSASSILVVLNAARLARLQEL